jgi:type IV pilus assembly protein PilO
VEKLLDRILKAPLGLKLGAVGGIVAALVVLNYFVVGLNLGPPISTVETKIRKTQADQATVDKEYIEKTSIANNLNQFRREKELLEQQLRDALAELPEEKNIEDLLQLFEDRARKAGLEIGAIEPGKPTMDRFYARIPIPMTVTGNYHEIATFFDSLGRMRRIVNVSDVLLDTPKEVNGKLVLNGKFLVTAFMFVEPAKAAEAAAKPARGGARSAAPAGGHK